MQNKIIVTKNFDDIINFHKSRFDGEILLYEDDELKIDISREIIQKAYLSGEKDRLFILAFKNYRIEAQNALLKIFEEPPRGVNFLLITPSKNILLPTICSRFIIEKYNNQTIEIQPEIDFSNFNYDKFYDFMKHYVNASKDEMLGLLGHIGKKYAKQLSQKDLDDIFTCYELIKTNTKNELILSKLGFIFLRNEI